jgi:hypothetical protein
MTASGVLRAVALVAAAAAIPWSTARGQVAAAPDSASLRAEAVRAQAAFERERVRRLPWAWQGASGSCDEVIGRFCYWHEDDGGAPWRPPPEDPAVAAARAELIAQLAFAAGALPGDGWILGQRVRYLVEAGRHGEAAAAARAARAFPGAPAASAWPRALEGYALHAAHDFAAAEGAFDAMLEGLPAGERERWTNVALLLEPPLARQWRRLDAAARASFAQRLWWLADPLWSVTVNERRTEHFARVVTDRLQEDARSPYDVAWGADLRELTLRYGWPVGWERARSRSGTLGNSARPGVVAHDPPGAHHFFPPAEVFAGPHDAPPGAWPLAVERPRSAYAPSYADSFVELAHQLAVFRRGDRAVVAAAWEREERGDAAIVVWAGPGGSPAIARAPGGGRAQMVEAPWSPAVVSVEARAGRRAARARYGLPLPSPPPLVSDLLLLAPGAPLPASLDEALAVARATERVHPRERVGLYFELYPPAGAGEARITVTVRDDRRGVVRRLAGILVVGGPRRATALSWSEPLPAGVTILPRAVAVSLPDLPRGRHSVVVAVEVPAGVTATAERFLDVR